MTMTFKLPSIRRDINLFKNSRFVGYAHINIVERLLKSYKMSAKAAAEHISWDNVVLYAVFDYAPKSLAILSVNFMTVVLKYEDYTNIVDKMASDKRFFFVRGRKEYRYE